MKRFKNSVYLFPGLLLVVVFMIIPLVITIMPTFINNGITFTNYTSVLTDPFYQSILIRTIRIGLVTTLICLVLGFPTAYFIVTGSELASEINHGTRVISPIYKRSNSWVCLDYDSR
ncbi:hypothetical protein [Erysipelothrix piscisicarius]|uniref:hypothetical protein n=1 Tax=Erysipelothrix piscisicarius TaxID=2485784 RepID=UPI002F95C90C